MASNLKNCYTAVENYFKALKVSPENFSKNSLGLIIDSYKKEGETFSLEAAAANVWFLTLGG